MKLGVVASYPVPATVEPEQKQAWQIEKAHDLGLGILGIQTDQPSLDVCKRLRDLADSKGIELEASIRGVWGLVGPESAESLSELRQSIARAKVLGANRYVRSGYGRLNIATSRFNQDLPIKEHLGKVTTILKEAAKVAEDEGIIIAIENHCDFSGPELAEVIAAVDSPAIQCCLDTANPFTVFSDPTTDLLALAPYAVTTHLKDLKIVQSSEPGRVPFVPVGCAVGEGHVDIPLTIRTLAEKGPRGIDTPLIVELGWVPRDPQVDPAEHRAQLFARSFEYLRAHFAQYLAA